MKKGSPAPASADIKEVSDVKSVLTVDKGFAMSDNAIDEMELDEHPVFREGCGAGILDIILEDADGDDMPEARARAALRFLLGRR